MILDDANSPAVERGVYVISYGELVDGYRHAYRDEKRRRVRYSRSANHPPDPRCPECAAHLAAQRPTPAPTEES